MQPPAKKSGYLCGLDGWRAIAILSVMFTHDAPWQWKHVSLVDWQPLGGMGVGLFFAISGFLITTRILEEEKSSGRFHLKSFYIRRVLRIQPAALVYLFVAALLAIVGLVPTGWRFLIGALFLYRNFQNDDLNPYGGYYTGHFWTLSVEEHFYLLLSLFLFFIRKSRAFGLILLIAAVFAVQSYMLRHQQRFLASNKHTYMVLQFLLIPSLLAVWLQRPAIYRFTAKWLRPWAAFAITALLIFLDCLHRTGGHIPHRAVAFFTTEGSALSYCFPLWIIATVMHPHSFVTRLLEWHPLRWIGRLSYSLYLWHILIFYAQVTRLPHFLSERPWNYVAAFSCALLSYYFVEKPCIRLGHRLAPPVTPGHRDLAATAN